MDFLFFFFLLGHVIYVDMAKKKILNFSVLAFFLMGINFLVFYKGNSLSEGWVDAITASIGILVFFICFHLVGWMGAGDVKFAAALAFCLGVEASFYVWVISVTMALLYSSIVFLQARVHAARTGVLIKHGVKYVPYGALLSASTMIYVLAIR